MSKNTQTEITIEGLISKIERVLDTEIDNLGDTLSESGISPEKRIEFISKTLPIVIKYREGHSDWSLG